MRSSSLLLASTVALSLATFTGAGARAGLSYVAVNRRVEVGTGNYQTPEAIDNGPRLSHSSAGRGRFDASLRSSFVDGTEGLTEATASQHSIITDSMVSATGTGSVGTGAAPAEYRSRLDVTFDATAGTCYALDAALKFIDPTSGFYEPFIDLFRVSLSRLGPRPATLAEGPWSDGAILVEHERPVVSSSGVLPAGRYELLMDVHGFAELGGHEESYRLSFNTSGGSGGGGPTAVPLPPAAWAGLLTLAGLAAARAWAARRARYA